MLTLEEMGIPVEHAQHEDAPSQHEIDLRYTDALTMADTVMTVRLVVKEMARQQGVFASFMPKPLAGVQGSGMHTHLSLFRDETNAFVDTDRPGGLSEVAEGFIAGLLRHAGEITAVTNQWVNSYKRLVSGYEAPIHVSWARNNRSALVRVPVVKPGKLESTRVEFRVARQRLQSLPRLRGHPGRRSPGDRAGLRAPAGDRRQPVRPRSGRARRQGHPPPSGDPARGARADGDLRAASRPPSATTSSSGSCANKRAEWDLYRAHVTQFELDRYLPLL